MKQVDKIEKLQKHLAENPADYQSQIALIKANSEQIAWEIKREQQKRLKKVAEYRRMYERKQQAK